MTNNRVNITTIQLMLIAFFAALQTAVNRLFLRFKVFKEQIKCSRQQGATVNHSLAGNTTYFRFKSRFMLVDNKLNRFDLVEKSLLLLQRVALGMSSENQSLLFAQSRLKGC